MDPIDRTVWALVGCAVYLGLCGAFGMYVALQKSREPWEGIIFGALLGPLGLLILVLLPNGRESAVRMTIAERLGDYLDGVKPESVHEEQVRAQLATLEKSARYSDTEWAAKNKQPKPDPRVAPPKPKGG